MCAIEFEPPIATERLRLRKPRKADAARIVELCNDRDVARMTTSMPHPYGQHDAETFLSTLDHSVAPTFAIEHPRAGAIGMIGFNADNEIGYWIGKPFWGEGYATEAAEAALVWANREWGRRFVKAGHFSDNPASGEVLCKAGFLYTGEVQLRGSTARGEPAPTRMMVWLA